MSQHSSAETEAQAKGARRVSRRRFLAISATSGAAIAAGLGSVAASSVEPGSSRSWLNQGFDFAQNPNFAEPALTKAKHKGEWGLTDDALTTYENDSGEED